jgi:predicted NAD-dependent protein-ADP-ribosyltransferase YbiA (DUF1768 family)
LPRKRAAASVKCGPKKKVRTGASRPVPDPVFVKESLVVKFYSKSAQTGLVLADEKNWRQYLSNFTLSTVEYDGIMFPSVEHAFAHCKYEEADELADASRPDFSCNASSNARKVGQLCGQLVDGDLKRAHGRKGMKKNGFKLDVEHWNEVRVSCLQEILNSRFESDPRFRRILRAAFRGNYYLLHVERSGPKSFWGGSDKSGAVLGQNQLGKMLMAFNH